MEKKEKILFLIDEFFPKINQAIRAVDNFALGLLDNFEPIVGVLGNVSKDYSYEVVSERSKTSLFKHIDKYKYCAVCVFSLNLVSF